MPLNEYQETMGGSQALDPNESVDVPNKRFWWVCKRYGVWNKLLTLLLFVNLGLIIREVDEVSMEGQSSLYVSWSMRVILLIFIVALCAEAMAGGWEFFKTPANIADGFVLMFDAVGETISVFAHGMPALSWIRIFRVLRLVRIIRSISMLRELSFMLTALGCALRSIVWSIVLLFFMLTFCSIVAVQVLHPLNTQIADSGRYDDCHRCARAFQTVMDANLTFLQTIVAGDSWGQVSIPLMETFPVTSIFFCLTLLVICLGVMNLILSTIVDNSLSAREYDNSVKLQERKRLFASSCKEFTKMCADLDQDSDGHLTKEELFHGFDANEHFAAALKSWDVEREDIDALFSVMDKDRSGAVEYEEFISALFRMQTESQQAVMYIIYQTMKDLKAEFLDIAPHVKECTSQPEQHNLEPATIPNHVSNQFDEELQHAQRVKANIHKVTDVKANGGSMNLNMDYEGMEPTCAGDALHIDIDNFILKLERHFCAMLQNLGQAEKVWSPASGEVMHLSTDPVSGTCMPTDKDQSNMSPGWHADRSEADTLLDDIPCESHLQPITSGTIGIGTRKLSQH